MEYEYEMVSGNSNVADGSTAYMAVRVAAGWTLHSHTVLKGDGAVLEHHYIWEKEALG